MDSAGKRGGSCSTLGFVRQGLLPTPPRAMGVGVGAYNGVAGAYGRSNPG